MPDTEAPELREPEEKPVAPENLEDPAPENLVELSPDDLVEPSPEEELVKPVAPENLEDGRRLISRRIQYRWKRWLAGWLGSAGSVLVPPPVSR